MLKEARDNRVVIQECNTNGDVRQEYVLLPLVEEVIDSQLGITQDIQE